MSLAPGARLRAAAGSASLPLVAVPVVVALGLVLLRPAPSLADTADDDPAALQLLRRAVVAAVTLPYEAEQLVGTWPSGPLDAPTATGSGSGLRTVTVRQDDAGHRWVGVRDTGSSGRQEVPVRAETVPAVDLPGLLAAAFALRLEAGQVVAGRRAGVVAAQRADRVAARWWIDEGTGLLLRSEAYAPSGRLLRMTAVTRLTVGARGPSAWRTAFPTVRAVGVSRPAATLGPEQLAALQRSGCACPQTLPGGYRLIDVRAVAGAGATHLTYADGVSTVSLFVQPGRLGAGVPGLRPQVWDGVPVHVAGGARSEVVWEGGDRVLTAVSDAPQEELHAVVAALPHGAAHEGLLDRVVRGLREALRRLVG